LIGLNVTWAHSTVCNMVPWICHWQCKGEAVMYSQSMYTKNDLPYAGEALMYSQDMSPIHHPKH
jgi:hypothetical protein